MIFAQVVISKLFFCSTVIWECKQRRVHRTLRNTPERIHTIHAIVCDISKSKYLGNRRRLTSSGLLMWIPHIEYWSLLDSTELNTDHFEWASVTFMLRLTPQETNLSVLLSFADKRILERITAFVDLFQTDYIFLLQYVISCLTF